MPDSPAEAELRIPCASGNPGTGNCGGRAEQLGISFVAPSSGPYRVCAELNHELSTDSTPFPSRVFFIWIRTNDNGTAIIEQGAVERGHGLGGISATQMVPLRVCDTFDGSATERMNLRLAIWQSGAIDRSEIIGSTLFEIERLAANP